VKSRPTCNSTLRRRDSNGTPLVLSMLIAPAAMAIEVTYVPQEVRFALREPHVAVFRSATEASDDKVLRAACDDDCMQALVSPIEFALYRLVVVATGSRSQDIHGV